MNRNELLANLASRGNGDVYLGVVGPVRTGKSTFVKRFMELAIIPNIENESDKQRAIDELPISGEGKTITTMEPKFVPNKGVQINVEGISINARLVDCVGYVVKDAKGYQDEDGIRMVKTPWYEDAIPFDEAAKIGTQKVIKDHSTIGIVIVSDGTILDIAKENYFEAENKVIDELIEINKPFVIVVNSKDPSGEKASNVVCGNRTSFCWLNWENNAYQCD
jgi:stage IV sporulation protein A